MLGAQPRPGAAASTWRVACLLGIAHLLALLPFVDDYGASWDEPTHRDWARRFDLWWRTGNWEPFKALGLEGRYAGPLYDYLNFNVFRLLRGLPGVSFMAASHALNLAAACSATALLFALSRELLGTRVASAAVLFWVLFPPLAAHAHYNPKDVVLAAAVLLLNLAGLRAIESGRARDWFGTGISFGLALAVKVSAVMALPQLAAALAAARLSPEARPEWGRLRREALRALAAAALGTLVGLFAFWPSMWKQPTLPAIGLYSRALAMQGDGVGLYLGKYSLGTELPWHYIPLWIAMSTPLLTLGCAGVGAVSLARRLRGEQRTGAALVLASLLVPLLQSAMPRLPRYDGMRQFFFCIPPLAILAGVGLVSLGSRAAAAGVPRSLRRGAVAALAAWLLVEVARGHPYQGSYVNELTRRALGPHIERSLVMEFWGSTYAEGFKWLNAHAAPGARVCIPVAGHLVTWYETRPDLRFDCGEDPHYVMLMANYPRREAETRGRTPVLTVSRYDSDLMYLHRVR